MQQFSIVFPGQGSQSVGMLDAWGDHPAVREVVREASDALAQDIGALIATGSKEELALTTNTQPVMLVAGVAAYRVWMAETGLTPMMVAGHSLGEYSALVAAGVMTLSQAAPLVRYRAQAMQEAVPVGHGAMAAVLGLDAPSVHRVCAEVSASMGAEHVVEAVNLNDPMQTVIAGTKAAVEAACVQVKAQGAKRALPLPVSAPFHSSLMRPAAWKLREKLAQVELRSPEIPLVNNVDVAVETDAERIRDALYRQAFGPVRWVETIQTFVTKGSKFVVECGPGKVLSGLCKRIDPALTGLAVFDPLSLGEARSVLSGGEVK